MNPTRSPLNEVQITELKNACVKHLSPYHRALMDRLVGEHAYLKSVTQNRRE